MAYHPDPVDTVPRKKKVFAEVQAVITLTAQTSKDAEALAEHFLKRRGITGSWSKKTANGKTVEVAATYRVHGGWASDFVRKITYDAADLGIDLKDLDVQTTRTEIPSECPRQECMPCAVALNPAAAVRDTSVPKRRELPAQETPVGTQPEPPKRRRFFSF